MRRRHMAYQYLQRWAHLHRMATMAAQHTLRHTEDPPTLPLRLPQCILHTEDHQHMEDPLHLRRTVIHHRIKATAPPRLLMERRRSLRMERPLDTQACDPEATSAYPLLYGGSPTYSGAHRLQPYGAPRLQQGYGGPPANGAPPVP
jgi:hypothetical protein